MSELAQLKEHVSINVRTFRCWVGTTLLILLIFSALNTFLTFLIIPKFQQIYQDALPGKPLPWLTSFILVARIPLMIVAVGWLIAGSLSVWRWRPVSILLLNLGIIFSFLQIVATIYALFIPLIGLN